MQKKLAFGAVFCVIAVFAAGMIAKGEVADRVSDVPETLRIETVISIDDDGLTELVAGAGSIWALNGSEGTTYEIKTTTNELGRVIETDDDSENLAVADGRVWTVTKGKGYVTTSPVSGELDGFRRFTVVPRVPAADDGGVLQLHSETDRVWVAAGVERPTLALDAASVGGYPPAIAATSLTNFTAIGGNDDEVWGITLDDRIAQLADDGSIEWDQRIEGNPNVRKIAVEGDGAWLLDDDRLVRIDQRTGRTSDLKVEARDIAVGDGLLWAVGVHRLSIFDAGTSESLGSIDIDANLLRVAYSTGSAWVLGSNGKIFRVSMSPEALKLTQPVQDDRLVYVYSSDGDLWGEQVDGDDVNLVAHRDDDRRPSMSVDGRTIAFQRDRAEGGRIFFLDLSNGRERFLGHGGWPTFGPGDRFAYVSRGAATDGINFVQRGKTIFVPTGQNPSHLRWDEDGTHLYYIAGPAGLVHPSRIAISGTGTPGLPEVLTPTVSPTGATFPVAAPDGDRLYVIRACCPNPGAEIIYEFGYIDLTSPTRPFIGELELTETGLGEAVTLTRMHGLTPPGLGDPQRWTESDKDAWLVSDGANVVYLLRDEAHWSFANQALEHPGRGVFDGFGRALQATSADPGEVPATPTPSPEPSSTPSPTAATVSPSPTDPR